MWTEPHRSSGLLRASALALLAGCANPGARAPAAEPAPDRVILGVEVMTPARQRVRLRLRVEDEDPATPAFEGTADLPAYSTSTDFVALLAFLLQEQDCPAQIAESTDPHHAPSASEALLLPPGFRVASLVIEKKTDAGWAPSGPGDLVCLP